MYSVAQAAHWRNSTQVPVLPARLHAQGAPEQPRAAAHRRRAPLLLLLQQELHAQGAPRQPRPVRMTGAPCEGNINIETHLTSASHKGKGANFASTTHHYPCNNIKITSSIIRFHFIINNNSNFFSYVILI